MTSKSDRERFLERECGADQKLRVSVEALIQNHKEETSHKETITPLRQLEVLGEKIGDIIGRYTLKEVIGKGGYGVVYRAEQQQPVCRTVALKVIQLGGDAKQLARRLESERQALAELEHSSIAKIYDGGTTNEGRPYFVLEYIRGTKITEYAEINQLTIPKRLELFRKVCMAVHHAHQKKIVHRDIKPSNILVTEENGEPLPKVIDFGIALFTPCGDSSKTTRVTETGQLLGTPAYMSPEQVTADREHIDYRTDIYSLGVVLHVLLVGSHPLALNGLELYQQLRTIAEEKPQTPSEQFASFDQSEQARVAESFRSEPSAIMLGLRENLDSIVSRCLEKDPKQRYQTAEALAREVQSCFDRFIGIRGVLLPADDPEGSMELSYWPHVGGREPKVYKDKICLFRGRKLKGYLHATLPNENPPASYVVDDWLDENCAEVLGKHLALTSLSEILAILRDDNLNLPDWANQKVIAAMWDNLDLREKLARELGSAGMPIIQEWFGQHADIFPQELTTQISNRWLQTCLAQGGRTNSSPREILTTLIEKLRCLPPSGRQISMIAVVAPHYLHANARELEWINSNGGESVVCDFARLLSEAGVSEAEWPPWLVDL